MSPHFDPKKQIAIIWSVVDVQGLRPDLTDEQAMEVLKSAKSKHDADIGVNWDTLRIVADSLYPKDSSNEEESKHPYPSGMTFIEDDSGDCECPLGGDESNDCEGCFNSGDYHFVNGECVERKENTTVHVVMIDDVNSESDCSIQECTVWSKKEDAIKHLKSVVKDYKEDSLKDYLADDDVSFTSENPEKKNYVMLDEEESFSFYEDGWHRDNHVEIWILTKEIDQISQPIKEK